MPSIALLGLALFAVGPSRAARGGAAPLAAEVVPIAVGSTSVTCHLAGYNNAWLWTVVFPDGRQRPQGLWSDRLESVALEGRQVWRRTQGMSYGTARDMVLVTVLDPATCGPISTEQRTVDGQRHLRRFRGTSVETSRTDAAGHSTVTTAEFPRPPFTFDNGEEALILASLPLREGFQGRISSIAEMTDSDRAREVTVKVVASEVLGDSHGRKHRAFHVVSSFEGATNHYWISKDPPYYLKLVVEYDDHRYRFVFTEI